MIPKPIIFSYMFNKYPNVPFKELLNRCAINLESEYQAIEDMRLKAFGPGVLQKNGITYFDLQYGKTQAERLKNLILEFGKLPSEIKRDKTIIKEFVTQNFIEAYKAIEEENVETCTCFGLTYMALLRVPKILSTLKNLKDLYLFVNHLQSLPPEIGQLTNLKSLNLKDNHLQSLPKEIGGLINLDTLWLNNNNLQPLPKEIGKLKNLSKLILFDNPMPKLPQTIKNLDNLFLLWLDHTDLAKELKLTFQQLRPSGKEDVQKLIKAALDS